MSKISFEQAVKNVGQWVNIKNEDSEDPIIEIDGTIGEDFWDESENTTKAVNQKLKEISNLGAKTITVNINSLGGSVAHGIGIHDVLAAHKATIITNVGGMTASAATIIAQAGDVRKMSDNALYLIHQPWSMFISNVSELEQNTEDLKTINDRLVKIYTKRSGQKEAKIRELMDEANGNGKWIDAEEAKEMGLIDEVYEPMKSAAGVRTLDFTKLPDSFTNKLPEIPKLKIKQEPMATKKQSTLLDTIIDGVRKVFLPDAEGKSTIPEDLQSQLNELQGSLDLAAEYEDKEKTLNEKITGLETDLTKANESVASLSTELAQAKGESTKPEGLEGEEGDSEENENSFGNMSEVLTSLRGETSSKK